MEPKEFITAIESYYGMRYESQLEIQLLLKYLAARSDLDSLFTSVCIHHSKKWKSLPDISILVECDRQDDAHLEAEALRYWAIINRRSVNLYTDVLCDDIRVQEAIVSMGGPRGIGDRDPQYENLHRKEFVRLFKLFTECRPATAFRVLPGILNINRRVYIGTQEACERLLAESSVPNQLADMREDAGFPREFFKRIN